jgi:hypothetical protein
VISRMSVMRIGMAGPWWVVKDDDAIKGADRSSFTS